VNIDIQPWETRLLDDLVLMWRASFLHGVGVRDPHTIQEQREFFMEQLLPDHELRVAMAGDTLVGFVAATQESVSQLYVRVGWHRQGIGTQLLDWAKAQSGGQLWLYAFQRNTVACAFYERHGFVAVARGVEPTWQLDDVKYAWAADGAKGGAAKSAGCR
jgi:ribosomal protein S18 acetylase RimI-like enzyme